MSKEEEAYAAAENAYLGWAENPHGFTGETLVYHCQNCGEDISEEDLEGFGSSGFCSSCIEVVFSGASCSDCGWVGSRTTWGDFCPECGAVLGVL